MNNLHSDDVLTVLPEPDLTQCPVGLQVNGSYVLFGSDAACKCLPVQEDRGQVIVVGDLSLTEGKDLKL